MRNEETWWIGERGRIALAVMAAGTALCLSACHRQVASNSPGPLPPVTPGPRPSPALPRTPEPGLAKYLPDPNITPGDTLDVTAADVCTRGYAGKVRNVPSAVKRQAYANYGIAHHEPGEYEVDHLISLEIGGSNSIRNLWPESYHGPWNAHVKDRLENELHRRVCAGEMDLATAQREIATDWVAAYKKYIGDSPGEGGGTRVRRRRRSVKEDGGY